MTVDGTRESVASLLPYATGGSFLNSLGDVTRTADAYTAGDWARLRDLKAAWDPDNVFGRNHNIPPAGAAMNFPVPGGHRVRTQRIAVR
jgi:hypothetical protein